MDGRAGTVEYVVVCIGSCVIPSGVGMDSVFSILDLVITGEAVFV